VERREGGEKLGREGGWTGQPQC